MPLEAYNWSCHRSETPPKIGRTLSKVWSFNEPLNIYIKFWNAPEGSSLDAVSQNTPYEAIPTSGRGVS